jgi:rare lipoprotein A (peptidoglycan hydrolase)
MSLLSSRGGTVNRRRVGWEFVAAAMLFFVAAGCQRRPEPPAVNTPPKKSAAAPSNDQTGLRPASAPPDFEVHAVSTQVGDAVWYDVPDQSLPERRAWPQEMTAASNRLPLQSYARITRLDSDKSVIVRITDNGIRRKGAVIDVCKEAAESLDMVKTGVVRVRVEELFLKNATADKPVEKKGQPIASKIETPAAASREQEKQAAKVK